MKKLLLFTFLFFFILFQINAQSKLIFSFDTAGNQNQRFYCEGEPCSPPVPAAKSTETIKEIAEIENLNAIENQDLIADSKLNIYPNPTRERVFITFQNSSDNSIKQLNVFNAYSSLVKIVAIAKNYNQLVFDLSGQASGLYLFVLVKEDGSTITEKVIKY
ncbi:MAG: T9SS type A sorting domain-containing protein [Lutibacter sp.]